MTTAYEEHVPGTGTFSLVAVDPARDAELMHGWVTQPANRFWGMTDHTVEQVQEIYEFVDSLPHHFAYLIQLNGNPIGIFQTYEPAHDPVGECYAALPGDIGLHLLLAPGEHRVPRLTPAVVPLLVRFVLRDPAKDRVVVEPDVRNHRAVRRMELHGFVPGPQIELPNKCAQLAFLTRDRFEAVLGPASSS
ncbi:GNAT family N-acetyltransferase [Catellatospora tritici]|uniref:GNAT family N-acetyltransferase n=1 Tax=Catellatospora tritici TaxID=2851566 RepID=UPI001C2D3BF1|nr:GNAT family N-acetyltransferase [Catellatospora tritici]MBV1853927.1 acetyltransferase [Catellatospora tritici]